MHFAVRQLKGVQNGKSPFIPGLIKEIGLTFYNEIHEIVHAHKIPPEMIINIDQPPLPFVLDVGK